MKPKMYSLALCCVFFIFTNAVSPASFTGRVYADTNHNGVYDAGQDLICADVPVQLINVKNNKVISIVTTDKEGKYKIDGGVSGTKYRLSFQFPFEYFSPQYGLKSTDKPIIEVVGGEKKPNDFILQPIIK